ncbi:diguanylate cyclase [Longispora urticae]
MSGGSEKDLIAVEWAAFRGLMGDGHLVEVIALAERVAAESTDPHRTAQALNQQLAAYLNLGRSAGHGPLLDRVHDALSAAPDPRLVGQYHLLAGMVAHEQGSVASAVTHVVQSERALRRMTEVSLGAVDAWHDLCVVYTAVNFYPEALEAMRQAARVCAAAGLGPAHAACTASQVAAAIDLDHHGDTEGCVRGLRALVASSRPFVAEIQGFERVFLLYAARRLGALGHPTDVPVPRENFASSSDRNVLDSVAVCEAIGAGDPTLALELLDRHPHLSDTMGVAEPLRLRSLALSLAGDHAGALEVERASMRMVAPEDRQVRNLFADSIGARLDQERLRRMAAQYANAASTDPLTGLPNRRRIAAFVAGLGRRGVGAMIGALDLDGFKAVNDTHGHPAGDLVLQRVAGIFAGAVRQGDLLARHGGDEFVVILPAASAAEAVEIGDRIRTAVDSEDWGALVPGTPVSVSVGWAPLGADGEAALRAADEALYRVKRGRTGVAG